MAAEVAVGCSCFRARCTPSGLRVRVKPCRMAAVRVTVQRHSHGRRPGVARRCAPGGQAGVRCRGRC